MCVYILVGVCVFYDTQYDAIHDTKKKSIHDAIYILTTIGTTMVLKTGPDRSVRPVQPGTGL